MLALPLLPTLAYCSCPCPFTAAMRMLEHLNALPAPKMCSIRKRMVIDDAEVSSSFQYDDFMACIHSPVPSIFPKLILRCCVSTRVEELDIESYKLSFDSSSSSSSSLHTSPLNLLLSPRRRPKNTILQDVRSQSIQGLSFDFTSMSCGRFDLWLLSITCRQRLLARLVRQLPHHQYISRHSVQNMDIHDCPYLGLYFRGHRLCWQIKVECQSL